MPCDCPFSGSPNKLPCPRHGVEKGPRWRALCQAGGDYYEAWEAGIGPGQKKPPSIESPEILPCRYRGIQIDTAMCRTCPNGGEIPIKVYACSIHQTCTKRRAGLTHKTCTGCAERSMDLPNGIRLDDNHEVARLDGESSVVKAMDHAMGAVVPGDGHDISGQYDQRSHDDNGEHRNGEGAQAKEPFALVHTESIPNSPIDAIFFLRHSSHGDIEIRYALRGIARHYPWIRRVFVLGDKPPFVSDKVIHVPHDSLPHSYKTPVTNFFLMFHLASLIPELSEEFLWFCDDFVPIGDLTPEMARVSLYSSDLAKAKDWQPGLWRDTLKWTADWLRRLKYPQFNFEPHVPTYFRKRWIIDAFREFRDYTAENRWTGMLGPTAILNHAVKANNAPVKPLSTYGGKAAWYDGKNPPTYETVCQGTAGRRYLNFDDGSFGPGLRRWLMERFPVPSKYERAPEPRSIPHRWQKITGWFDDGFRKVYSAAAFAARDGAEFVEIGSYLGKSTSHLATDLLNRGVRANFTAVDTWKGTPGRMKVRDYYPEFTENMRKGDDLFEIIRPFRCASVEASAAFPHESIDFLFIDGNHSYEAVKADIAAWLPKVRGVIAGHDYDPRHPGVIQAVDEAFGERAVVCGTSWAALVNRTQTFDVEAFFRGIQDMSTV